MLLVHPGASSSTCDVEAGLRYGLEYHGIDLILYRLDERFVRAQSWLYTAWRKAKKHNPTIERPTPADAAYQAGIGALEMALRFQVDLVLVVSAMLMHPDVLIMMRRAGLKTAVLFTETPYNLDKELRVAALIDACWTNDRASLTTFQAVNPHARYLPHAWHPGRHHADAAPIVDVPAHDVVFVGSGFPERVAWFNAIDWTGIDLGLYGVWSGLGLKKQVWKQVRAGAATVANQYAAALYRRARIGLNLYRTSESFSAGARIPYPAESLSPRAYELAACGAFHISDWRKEVPEVFGDLVPTFTTPAEAEALIRRWLPDAEGRAALAARLPACVAESTWTQRAAQVVGDVTHLLRQTRAA